MKVQIEIDCTPEEARTFMGLPDVGKANDVYDGECPQIYCGYDSGYLPAHE